jgi:nicotinate-nucleotide adenylyltransferase
MAIFSKPAIHNIQRWKNMRIGLLGGSFNPPHAGHLHISKIALKTLRLDAVWWLVTPQNPMKSPEGLPSVEERLELCRDIIDHPKIIATGIESKFKTTYSYATIKTLKENFPYTQFAFITGMDNAHNLHKWENWKELLGEVCVVHITRAPPVRLIQNCPVRMLNTQKHITLDRGGHVPLDSHTTYWILQRKMVDISSTQLRNNRLKTKS